MTKRKTIELDCPPGNPRPGDLIGNVVKGTVLEQHTQPANPHGACFGNWTWDYTDKVSEEEWRAVQEVTKPRIIQLYNSGAIRYGSW